MEKSNVHIMIVNDKNELRRLVRDYLREEGYTKLSISENGLSALKRAGTEPPDMIIADQELPGMSGMDLLKEIRQHHTLKDLPFILMSYETDPKFLALAAENQVSSYLVVPFTHQILAEKVNVLLDRRINPNQVDLLYQQANKMAESGKLEDALNVYLTVLNETQKSMASVHYKMGQVQEKLERDSEAESNYRQAIGLSDLYLAAYDAMGQLNLRREMPQQALPYLQRGSDINPLNASRQFNLGEALMQVGNDKEAEKAYRMALDLDPTQTHVFNRLGIALRRQGKLYEAAQYLLMAVNQDPNDENLYFNLSRVYFEQDKVQEARVHLNKALKLNPDFKEANELMEKIMAAVAQARAAEAKEGA